jgi:spore maturation protein CgeB
MLGACYLTEWTEDIPHLYEPGKEIETYRTAEELVEKLSMLHAEPERRKRLRLLGQRRALECHSVGRSLARISEALNLEG